MSDTFLPVGGPVVRRTCASTSASAYWMPALHAGYAVDSRARRTLLLKSSEQQGWEEVGRWLLLANACRYLTTKGTFESTAEARLTASRNEFLALFEHDIHLTEKDRWALWTIQQPWPGGCMDASYNRQLGVRVSQLGLSSDPHLPYCRLFHRTMKKLIDLDPARKHLNVSAHPKTHPGEQAAL